MTQDIFMDLKEDFLMDNDTFTPLISSLGVKNTPSAVNQRIKDLERNGYTITENDFQYIDSFLNSSFFEEDRKEELKKHLGESYKKHLLDKIFNNISFVPIRLNGVPIKNKNSIPSQEIKDFLVNGTISEKSQKDIMFYSTLLDFCQSQYFTSEFCYEKIKPQLQYLEKIKPYILEQRELLASKKDQEYLDSMKKERTNQPEKKHHINSRLKQQILSKIPEGFNQLEKSIFIYLKMCDCFSYDPKFYASAVNHMLEHESVSNIERLSKENNEVVCFEFTYASSDLLTSIGVDCVDNISYFLSSIGETETSHDTFDSNHANLKFVVDDTIVFADSTRSVLRGDLSEWKYTKKPSGIRCENYSLEKRENFNNALSKVVDHINQQEERFHIKAIKEEYEEREKQKHLDMHDKMLFFYEKVVQFPYDEVDLLAFIYRLKEVVFTKEELSENFSAIPIKNAADEMNLILSANKTSFNYSPYDTQYYFLDIKTKQIEKQQPKEVVENFKDRSLTTVEQADNIPALQRNSNYLKEQAERMVEEMVKGNIDVNGNIINQQGNPNVQMRGFTEKWLLCLLILFSGITMILIKILIG